MCSYRGCKATGAWSWPLTLCQCRSSESSTLPDFMEWKLTTFLLYLTFRPSLILPLLISSSCIVLVPFHLLLLPFISLTISRVFPPFVLFFFMSAVTIFSSPVLNLFCLAVIVAGVLDRLTIGYLFNSLISPCKRHAVRPSLQIILNCHVNSLHTYPVGLSTSREHWNNSTVYAQTSRS